jgi:hypothetical protein
LKYANAKVVRYKDRTFPRGCALKGEEEEEEEGILWVGVF